MSASKGVKRGDPKGGIWAAISPVRPFEKSAAIFPTRDPPPFREDAVRVEALPNEAQPFPHIPNRAVAIAAPFGGNIEKVTIAAVQAVAIGVADNPALRRGERAAFQFRHH